MTGAIVLVLSPNSGDVIQAKRAGILEIADIHMANESDLRKRIEYQFGNSSSTSLKPSFATGTWTDSAVRERPAMIYCPG